VPPPAAWPESASYSPSDTGRQAATVIDDDEFDEKTPA
jgi:hypothetical protein